jgi:hypothetical protein
VASLEDRRFRLIEVIFAGAVAISCEGAGAGTSRSSPRSSDQATVSELTAAGPATDEQARAAAYARQATVYTQLAAANRAAATAAAQVAAKETAAAAKIDMSATSSSISAVSVTETAGPTGAPVPMTARDTLTGLAAVAARKQADRQKVAAAADRLAASAQRAADFHTAKATELATGTPGGAQ